MPESGKGFKTTRIAVVILGITFWSFLIILRLVQLQVFQHRTYAQKAEEKQRVTRPVLAPRGTIYDSRMDELATNVSVSTAHAEPHNIKDAVKTARDLSRILNMDSKAEQKLASRLSDRKRKDIVIQRKIDPNAEKEIEALGIDGVYFVEESMRVYPHRELACHALGFVNDNGDGMYGVEQQYDRYLKGKEGLVSRDVDAHRRSYHAQLQTPPVQGCSLVLSIDKSIQYIADRELKAGVDKAQARAGTAIVMESDTGRILALSNYPHFNCNNFFDYEADFWRNRAISDAFEPGSTFKVVVAASALEAGLVRAHELIDCQMGSIRIGGHLFRDHKGYGLLSYSEILEFSSNVGAAKLGQRLGEQRLYDSIKNFGFGSRTGIDLPGEIAGLLRDVRDWSGLSIGAISFGQEVGVTSIQIVGAINSIANGGYRIRPTVLDKIIDEKGDLVQSTRPERVRLMSRQTADTVAGAFEGVVLRGTGKRAALEGYRAAGKTGTAQKIENGRYSPNKYVASFIGFAPLPRPVLTILVQIDEPKGSHYGGDVSAPIFQKIAQDSLMQLRVPSDPTVPVPQFKPQIAEFDSEDYIPDAVQPVKATGKAPKEESREIITVKIEGGNDILVPDFRGMGKRTVLDRCTALGIRLHAQGSGVAVFQSPGPGLKMAPGAACTVTFAKRNLKEQMAAADAHYDAQRSESQTAAAQRP